MSKIDARRVQMLVRQREALEKELEALQRDVEELVCPTCIVRSSIFILIVHIAC